MFDGHRLRIAGHGLPLGGGVWKPLTVSERLDLQRRLARAEFLARSRIVSW